MPAAQAAISPPAQPAQQPDELKTVRLHITPFRPELLSLYLAPSVLPLATNISYHTVETFPEKGFGYVELPEAEAQKLKKKLNGSTLKGSKVRIEMAKSEKRKAREEADAAKDAAEAERSSKRSKKEKKEKKRKEQGILEGVELPDERKVKRGWTEPPSKSKKERKEKKDKTKDKEAKHQQKASKYTKEPELLFKAKLTPVAATEVARKEKKDKKEKKEKKDKKSKSREVIVHEFEKNSKTPSFLKETKIVASNKPAVEYVNGQGWVDEDGNVVEPETGKARNRRVLELVDKPVETENKKTAVAPAKSSKKESKKAKITPPPESSSEDESEESSVVSSSSEDESSDSEDEESDAESASPTPDQAINGAKAQQNTQSTPSTEKEVHPLEALFKRPKPESDAVATPVKKLTPINTSFSFFDNEETMDVDETGEPVENAPTTPFTQRDLEWRGLRSAAPTPDTAAIGRRFSFDWRKGSHDADDDDDDDDDMADIEAEHQLSQNTKANASNKRLPGLVEEDEDEDADTGAAHPDANEEKPESEFRKWFWENRGDLNRAWKKRRRDTLKAKRHSENRKMTSHRNIN